MALFVKRFNRMMSKKNFGKRGQSSRKNPFVDKKNDEKKKKKFIKKKKNVQAYFVA